MPCELQSASGEHAHNWPTTGELTIERCERFCSFCTGEGAEHVWKFAWFLRRHVQTVHLDSNEYPNLILVKGWSRAPGGNASSRRTTRRRTSNATQKTQQRQLDMVGHPVNVVAVPEPVVQLSPPPTSAYHFFSPTAPAMAGFDAGFNFNDYHQATHEMEPALLFPDPNTGPFGMTNYAGVGVNTATPAPTATAPRSSGKSKGLTLNTNIANGLSSTVYDGTDGTPTKTSPLGSPFSIFLIDSLRNTPVATTPNNVDMVVTHDTPESVPGLSHVDDETMIDDSEGELEFDPMESHFRFDDPFGLRDMEDISKPETPLSANVLSLITTINAAVSYAAMSGRVTTTAKQIKALQIVLNDLSTGGDLAACNHEEILSRL